MESNAEIGPPQCLKAAWSRANHLGNGIGGFMNGYNLTFPRDFREHCAMRIRYNITTGDYPGLDWHDGAQVNAALNARTTRPGNPTKINIGAYHGLNATRDATMPYLNERGYHLQQNPDVEIFDFYPLRTYCPQGSTFIEGTQKTRCNTTTAPMGTRAMRRHCPETHELKEGDPNTCTDPLKRYTDVASTTAPINGNGVDQGNNQDQDPDFKLQLAINSNQFGRTFQDRTHQYKGIKQDDDLKEKCTKIYALNGRGKRGNIVQTFPGVEYDFTPNRLHIAEGECVHFQWTGSNTNPNNNDGQGKRGTDRHNIALMERIRGEGGRGVEKFGGKGRGGTTWTTAGMEPGWESWDIQNQPPIMRDIQCPPLSGEFPTHKQVHPQDWRKCVQECVSTSPTDPCVPCQWRKPEINGQCATGFVLDPTKNTMCITAGCQNFVARDFTFHTDQAKEDVRTWRAGNDPWDPNFDYNSDTALPSQIGVINDLRKGAWGMSHPEHLDNVTEWGFLGLTRQELIDLATLDRFQYGGEMSELDDAGTYHDFPVHKVTGLGHHYYMCTRNNNFSNRSQKGSIVVTEGPELNKAIGTAGGVVTLNAGTVYKPPSTNEEVEWLENDFGVQIPKGALPATAQVEMKVMPATGGSAASDVMWVGPANLASEKQFPNFQLTAGGNRRRNIPETIIASFRILNATAIWYRVSGEDPTTGNLGLRSLVKRGVTSISLSFVGYASVQVPLAENGDAEGTWIVTPAVVLDAEAGKITMKIEVDGVSYSGQAMPREDTGAPITMKLPVALTLDYGNVYFYPPTAAVKACMQQWTSGCAAHREQVEGATIKNGVATFQVSGSQTRPAGGYYQVGSGSNLPIVVGVACACAVIVLASVGSAIYFRKHPEKWDKAKAWGPAKYKSVKRSFSSQV
jgi:hypothetical protein